MMRTGKYAFLTLDFEPDHCDLVKGNHYDAFRGIPKFLGMIRSRGITVTVFATGIVLEEREADIRTLVEAGAEVELHSYSHKRGTNGITEITKGIEAYRRIFGRSPKGYRAARGMISDEEIACLAAQGFHFDSSLFPSFFPGRFCNIAKPTAPFFYPGTSLLEIPFSVISRIRFPVSLSYIQLAGFPTFRALKCIFGLPDILIIDLHLHDLFPPDIFRSLPVKWKLVYSRCFMRHRERGLNDLEDLIRMLEGEGYTFGILGDLYRDYVKAAGI
ncbi:MAG: polysaccharide deacetylase family protein [Candidatus Aureabacteria bacterium]|nr:polysaccharide deacetylase family protein [Candidatus Auribacterota bacterium]